METFPIWNSILKYKDKTVDELLSILGHKIGKALCNFWLEIIFINLCKSSRTIGNAMGKWSRKMQDVGQVKI